MKRFASVAAVSVLALACAFAADPALACSVPPPDPWFRVHVEWVDARLPAGVRAAPASGVGVWIENDLSRRLVLHRGGPGDRRPLVEVAPGARLRIGPELLASRYPTGDSRPQGIAVPPPEVRELTGEVGGAPVELHFRIRYELNADYVPDRQARGAAACPQLWPDQAGPAAGATAFDPDGGPAAPAPRLSSGTSTAQAPSGRVATAAAAAVGLLGALLAYRALGGSTGEPSGD